MPFNFRNEAALLHQAAALFRHRSFNNWYTNNTARFEWATSEIHGRLRRELKLPADKFGSWMGLAAACSSMAEKVEAKYRFGTPSQEKKFVVARSKGAEMAIPEWAAKIDAERITRLLNEFGVEGAEVAHALVRFSLYARARKTLAYGMGNEALDTFLEGVTEDYMLNGYPYDLLAHDAALVEGPKKLIGVVLRKDYCSTRPVLEGQRMPVTTSEHTWLAL